MITGYKIATELDKRHLLNTALILQTKSKEIANRVGTDLNQGRQRFTGDFQNIGASCDLPQKTLNHSTEGVYRVGIIPKSQVQKRSKELSELRNSYIESLSPEMQSKLDKTGGVTPEYTKLLQEHDEKFLEGATELNIDEIPEIINLYKK